MESIYEKHLLLTPEYLDARLGLSPAGAQTIFQGIAAEHAELLGCGCEAMTRLGQFWLTVHTRLEFPGKTFLLQNVTAKTWPEKAEPSDRRIYRSYVLEHDGKPIALGKSEWAILGREGKLYSFAESTFPKDFDFPEKTAIEAMPRRIRGAFPEEPCGSYTVRSTDIDFGQHMNNIAYIRVVLDQFSARELASGRIKALEIHYGSSALEGETLTIFREDKENSTIFELRRPNGKAAAVAEVEF